MANILIIAAAVIAGACVFIAAAAMIKRRRTVERLEKMLNDAINGSFTEESFDETRESSIENRMGRYLAASENINKNLQSEKDKIKTLIADISHQTKTPIANIQLYSDLMSESRLPREAREYLTALKGQTDKLSFLIASLVKLSRLETGIMSLYPQPANVRHLINAAEQACREKALAKGLELRVEAEDIIAVFDEKWTEEALCNIIDNAIKYTDRGFVAVSVKKYEMFLAIDVSDTGPGIDEAEIPKLFSRFYRGENVRDMEGVGIGLYLTREIITGENGYMKVTSEKGRGSVFSVFLPLERK